MECRSLRESGKDIRAFDVALYAASCDDADTNRRFAESLSLDYPILSDPDRKLALAMGVVERATALPKRWTFIIGKDGRIADIDTDVSWIKAGPRLVERLTRAGVARTAPAP